MDYELRAVVPDPERYVELREAGDMRGLPNTVYGVTVVETGTGETVGMARIVGDEGIVYYICDMVVHPDHQGQGLGSRLMDALMDYIEENAPETAYINLMADVDGFYERFGFEETRPASKGMYLRTG